MANEHLQLKPHMTPDMNVWWYEEPAGIVLVRADSSILPGISNHSTLIRWSSIRAALRRKDKAAKKQ